MDFTQFNLYRGYKMALTETEKVTIETDENGAIRLKKITTIFKDGVKVSRSNHREVLDPDSADYSKKLAAVTTSLVGQLAIDQNKIIAEKNAEKDALGNLNAVLAKNLEDVTKEKDLIEKERDSLIAEKLKGK